MQKSSFSWLFSTALFFSVGKCGYFSPSLWFCSQEKWTKKVISLVRFNAQTVDRKKRARGRRRKYTQNGSSVKKEALEVLPRTMTNEQGLQRREGGEKRKLDGSFFSLESFLKCCHEFSSLCCCPSHSRRVARLGSAGGPKARSPHGSQETRLNGAKNLNEFKFDCASGETNC